MTPNSTTELSPQHPIFCDTCNLRDYVKENKLHQFNVAMLKKILLHFDVAFKTKDKKKDSLQRLSSFVQEGQSSLYEG